MIVTNINSKWYKCPAEWNDLTGKQLVKVVTVFENPGEVIEAQLKLLKIITGMNLWQWIRSAVDDLADRFHLIDFLIKENGLTKNLLPKYKGFAGPADDFQNLSMSEFVYSEDFYLRWKEDESKTELLDQLVAVLYRKQKPGYDEEMNEDGDVRLKFNEYVCKYHGLRSIKRWPLNVKKAIAYWYDGCRKKLVNDFSEIFTGSGGEPAKYGLLSIMTSVAEKGTFGPLEKVEGQYVRLVLMKLDEMMMEAKQIKAVS